MDQEEGHGHHAITREAVHQLFEHDAEVDGDGLVSGLTEEQYAEKLDEAQEHQDRAWGPTTHAAWADPDAQSAHGMADPSKSGDENLADNRDFVRDEMQAARGEDELTHLGAAAHSLEDSYSGAHAFRDQEALERGDPTAAVESFNVFDPLPNIAMGTLGKIANEQGTHDERFDEVPVGENGELVRGGDQTAANAVAQLLIAHEDAKAGRADDVDATIDSFYQGAEGGVGVNTVADEEWRAERDERLGIDHEVTFKDQVMDTLREMPGSELLDVAVKAVEAPLWAAGMAVGAGIDLAIDAGEAIADVASDVADVAVSAGEAVVEGVGYAAEAVGNAVDYAADAVADTASDVVDFLNPFD